MVFCIVVILMDNFCCILWVNEDFIWIIGYDVDEVLGKSLG